MNLHLSWDGTHPVVLNFTGPEGLTVTARIEPDPEARPFWLGRLIPRFRPGAIRLGPSEWFQPAIPMLALEAGLAPLHGKRKARLLAHDRIAGDCRRLRRYGLDWRLYRLKLTVFRNGREIGSDTIGGLNEHGLPFHDTALIEALLKDVLARASGASQDVAARTLSSA